MTTVGGKNFLAIHGGKPTLQGDFRRYNHIGQEELAAVVKVVESGVLSRFLGEWHQDFYGGPKVQEFERSAAEYFGVEHAVTVNSWTSGLIAAVGAIGLAPGDEVIVSPWTMSASATAIVHWNGVPVFADVEEDTFCLDPASVEDRISSHTRAIMAVDIFGQSADVEALTEIAQRHGLRLIFDTAQSPGARVGKAFAGTFGDVGGYSLNYHKHIHTGEGGIAVTNDPELAERMRLIRNHAEAVVAGKGTANLTNMIGYNFRLGEIEAAIGIEQLRKLDGLVESRQRIAARLNSGLSALAGLTVPLVRDNYTHVYYNYAMRIDSEAVGVDKSRICQALTDEGVPSLSTTYMNLHLMPMFQKKIAFGSEGFPWSPYANGRSVDYSKGTCPTAERLQDQSYLGFGLCEYELSDDEVDGVIEAFHKVWLHMDELASS